VEPAAAVKLQTVNSKQIIGTCALCGTTEEGAVLSCVLRSPWHPIFVSFDGDARVQRQVLRQMGKVAPSWGEYPLTEGVI